MAIVTSVGLAAFVERSTMLHEGFLTHAAHEAMTEYLEDWEQAHARLGHQIAALRTARDQRKADADAGRWPPAKTTEPQA